MVLYVNVHSIYHASKYQCREEYACTGEQIRRVAIEDVQKMFSNTSP
jgi:hypothetical protein